ncbi:MAG: DUF302 domain-containing protein [Deltaproteobacteria bacterium]
MDAALQALLAVCTSTSGARSEPITSAAAAPAHQPQIGLLLPCNVVVQDVPEGGVVVSIADPRAMFTLVDSAAVSPVAAEAEDRVRRVIDAVGGKEAV